MLQVGEFNNLTVVKQVDFGFYLDGGEQEILLPNKYVPDNLQIEDSISVFIYRDSSDRLIATTLIPKVKVNQFAFLKVKDVNKTGAFLDWGLEKDLFVPYKEQREKMIAGNEYVVYCFLDERTDRLVGSTDLNTFFEKENIDLKPNQEVDLLVYKETVLGFSVVINNQYSGVVYHSDDYKKIKTGDRLKGYILKIRDDLKIDVTIRKIGLDAIEESKSLILDELKKWDGYLGLSDHSNPELIKTRLNMSKKIFKKAIGGLYKDGKIELLETGIRLK